jgi:hypothetical protein
MSADKVERYGKLRFAAVDMGAISGKTFDEVFESNKDFVDFTVKSMSHGCGVFKFWIEYIKLKKSQHA